MYAGFWWGNLRKEMDLQEVGFEGMDWLRIRAGGGHL
jgi:hypothetical protein